MNVMLFVRFTSAEQLQACLYYFDPATTLPYADEVEPAEAERIDAAEELPTANGILPASETAAFIDVTLVDYDWEEELEALRAFIYRFKPMLLASYFDTLDDYSAFWVASKKKWHCRYVVGDDADFDEALSAYDDNHQGWSQRMRCFLTRAQLL